MKKYILLLCVIFVTQLAFSQGLIPATRFTASIGSFTSTGPYDFNGAVGTIGSTGFNVDDIVVGAFLTDDNSLYYIDSVDIIVAGSVARIWVTDLDNAGAPISGRGQITVASPNYNLQPLTQTGSNFITEEQEAKILTHNFMLLDSLLANLASNALPDTLIYSKVGASNPIPISLGDTVLVNLDEAIQQLTLVNDSILISNAQGVDISRFREIEYGTGLPSSSPTGDDPILYQNVVNGFIYVWDGTIWSLFAQSIGFADQTFTSNRLLDFSTFIHTWDLTNSSLDENTWTVLSPDGRSYGFYVADGSGDMSLKFDALINADFKRMIFYDRVNKIEIGNNVDSLKLFGTKIIINPNTLSLDNTLTEVIGYDPLSGELYRTEITSGISSTDTIFYIKNNEIVTPINVQDTLIFDFLEQTISSTDTLFFVESNNIITPAIQGDTLFFGLGNNDGSLITKFDKETYFLSQAYGDDNNGIIEKESLPFLTLNGFPTANNRVFLNFKDGTYSINDYGNIGGLFVDEKTTIDLSSGADSSTFYTLNNTLIVKSEGVLNISPGEAKFKALGSKNKWDFDISTITSDQGVFSGLNTMFYPGGGYYDIAIDSLSNRSTMLSFFISDEHIPFKDLDSSIYNIKIKNVDQRSLPLNGRFFWYYGPRVNNTDTIEAVTLNLDIDNFEVSQELDSTWFAYHFTYGGSGGRAVMRNASFKTKINNFKVTNYGSTPDPNTLLVLGSAPYQYSRPVGRTDRMIVDWGDFIESSFFVDINNYYDPQGYTLVYDTGITSDSSYVLFDVNRCIVKNTPVYLNGGIIRNNSTYHYKTDLTKSSGNSTLFINDKQIINNSKLIIEGNFESSSNDYSSFHFSSNVDSTSKIIFRNVNITNNSEFAITSNDEKTIYVEGYLNLNGSKVGDNITLVYLDQPNKMVVNQDNHGLTVYDPIFYDKISNNWIIATNNNADSISSGMVIGIIDANNFIYQSIGTVTLNSHPFTVGENYYLGNGFYQTYGDILEGDIVRWSFNVIDENTLDLKKSSVAFIKDEESLALPDNNPNTKSVLSWDENGTPEFNDIYSLAGLPNSFQIFQGNNPTNIVVENGKTYLLRVDNTNYGTFPEIDLDVSGLNINSFFRVKIIGAETTPVRLNPNLQCYYDDWILRDTIGITSSEAIITFVKINTTNLIAWGDGNRKSNKTPEYEYITIDGFERTEQVTVGETNGWANSIADFVGKDVVEVQYAFRTAHTGGNITLEMTDGTRNWATEVIADGDRVATSDLSSTPHPIVSEELFQPVVVNTNATSQPIGLSVTLKIKVN